MPKKDLKSAMELLNKKAEAENPMAEVEAMAHGKLTDTQVPPAVTVGKIEQLSGADGALPAWKVPADMLQVDKQGKVFLSNDDMEKLNQNTIRVMQELKELKDSMTTIESVLTKLVIQSSPTPSKPVDNAPQEMESYSTVIPYVVEGLKGLKESGHNRVKLAVIVDNLLSQGVSIPNVEEFKKVLKATPGFKYFPGDASFSYTGE